MGQYLETGYTGPNKTVNLRQTKVNAFEQHTHQHNLLSKIHAY